jgi:hypothetical protein
MNMTELVAEDLHIELPLIVDDNAAVAAGGNTEVITAFITVPRLP